MVAFLQSGHRDDGLNGWQQMQQLQKHYQALQHTYKGAKELLVQLQELVGQAQQHWEGLPALLTPGRTNNCRACQQCTYDDYCPPGFPFTAAPIADKKGFSNGLLSGASSSSDSCARGSLDGFQSAGILFLMVSLLGQLEKEMELLVRQVVGETACRQNLLNPIAHHTCANMFSGCISSETSFVQAMASKQFRLH